jgi:hypothetical protein
VFKAKALYGSGTESGEWIVNVVDFVDLVEDFKSYPKEILISNPGGSLEGTHTKVTLNTNTGGMRHQGVVVTDTGSSTLWFRGSMHGANSSTTLAYSLGLKQGSAKSATIYGIFSITLSIRVQLEFLRNNVVVSSMLYYEGKPPEEYYERDVAPDNGQAFDTLKFVVTTNFGNESAHWIDIGRVTFKS